MGKHLENVDQFLYQHSHSNTGFIKLSSCSHNLPREKETRYNSKDLIQSIFSVFCSLDYRPGDAGGRTEELRLLLSNHRNQIEEENGGKCPSYLAVPSSCTSPLPLPTPMWHATRTSIEIKLCKDLIKKTSTVWPYRKRPGRHLAVDFTTGQILTF